MYSQLSPGGLPSRIRNLPRFWLLSPCPPALLALILPRFWPIFAAFPPPPYHQISPDLPNYIQPFPPFCTMSAPNCNNLYQAISICLNFFCYFVPQKFRPAAQTCPKAGGLVPPTSPKIGGLPPKLAHTCPQLRGTHFLNLFFFR